MRRAPKPSTAEVVDATVEVEAESAATVAAVVVVVAADEAAGKNPSSDTHERWLYDSEPHFADPRSNFCAEKTRYRRRSAKAAAVVGLLLSGFSCCTSVGFLRSGRLTLMLLSPPM